MKEIPIFYYFIVNRDQKTKLRYSGYHIPRIGDSIVIGSVALKVVDVVVESAKHDDEGTLHALYVHVQEAAMPLVGEDCDDLEFDEFRSRLKK